MSRRFLNRLAISGAIQPTGNQLTAGAVVVLLPLAPSQLAWQQYVYRLAVAKAQKALEPPRHVRQFLASWN